MARLMLVIIVAAILVICAQATRDEERLMQHLFKGYRKESKPEPLYDFNETAIVVQMRLFLFKIHDIVEKNELIETTARLQFHWRDRRFMWNENDYGGVNEISLPANLFWLPNIELFNSATDFYTLTQDTRFQVKIHSDGSFWWHPSGNFATRCQLQLRYFPFDQQTCDYVFESPLLTADRLQVISRRNKRPIDFTHYTQSGKYKLQRFGGKNYVRIISNSTAFSGVAFYVKFRRKMTFYVLNIMLPLTILAVLQLTTFFLPADDITRVQQSTTVLLAVVVFQTITIQELPRISDSVPLLCVYVGTITLLSALVIAESIVVGGMLRSKRPVPQWLNYLGLGTLKASKVHEPPSQVDKSTQSCSIDISTTTSTLLTEISLSDEKRQRLSTKFFRNDDSPIRGIYGPVAVEEAEQKRRRFRSSRTGRSKTVDIPAVNGDQMGHKTESDWTRLAIILDWMMFALCAATVGFAPIVMFVWLPMQEPELVDEALTYRANPCD